MTNEEYIQSLESDREMLLDDNERLNKENEELQERVKELEDLIDDFMMWVKRLKYIDYK